MSYDLHAFLVPPGVSPADHARAVLEAAARPPAPAPPEARESNERLAAALVARCPELVRFDTDREDVELIAEPIGVQVTLTTDSAFVSVPYWHEGEAARAAFAVIWAAVRVLAADAGYAIHDPQRDAFLDLGADFDAVVAGYEATIGRVHGIFDDEDETEPEPPPPKKPWWKLW